MKRIAAGVVTVLGLTAAQCAAGGGGGGLKPCSVIVVSDTVEAVASGDTVMVATKGDTVPKPHKTCVTLYAQSKDTVPKP
jgi:hypothetical protein